MDRKMERQYAALSPFELKNKLIELASHHRDQVVLNAGRGNPNWLAVTPRQAFFSLGRFAMDEAQRGLPFPHLGRHVDGDGIAERFFAYAEREKLAPGMTFLRRAIDVALERLDCPPDALVLEFTQGAMGDFYPEPDRMLVQCERLVHHYLLGAMGVPASVGGRYDLFATEGGTAGMRYCFDSLMENKLLRPGDRIALGAPIFTPYLEIPHLSDYGLVEVPIHAVEAEDWQYPDAEIDKLLDPRIKAFFVVNPGNPHSRAISAHTLARIGEIVQTKRPDLILMTDDVYGTFVDDFRSLMGVAPRNTLCVYSFSKHYGCTGWRLAVVALHEDNVLDRMIAELPEAERQALHTRYERVAVEPSRMKFIDRMVADSRSVALNHTAGLSLPQQVQMALFALFGSMPEGLTYMSGTRAMLNARLQNLYEAFDLPVKTEGNDANYYTILDILAIARRRYGEAFARYLDSRYEPLDFVFRMADEHAVVLLNGAGFGGPAWSMRVSLANLDDAAYLTIGRRLAEQLERYHAEWRSAAGAAPEGG